MGTYDEKGHATTYETLIRDLKEEGVLAVDGGPIGADAEALVVETIQERYGPTGDARGILNRIAAQAGHGLTFAGRVAVELAEGVRRPGLGLSEEALEIDGPTESLTVLEECGGTYYAVDPEDPDQFGSKTDTIYA